MPTPQLTVHNAEIKTATVEIKTLTVSGKQVTLAVFRQLLHESWLDRSGRPRSEAWGQVNYHPDKRCTLPGWKGGLDGVPHIHVVWQLDSELRRATVLRPNSWEYDDAEVYERWMAAWQAAEALPQLFIAV